MKIIAFIVVLTAALVILSLGYDMVMYGMIHHNFMYQVVGGCLLILSAVIMVAIYNVVKDRISNK